MLASYHRVEIIQRTAAGHLDIKFAVLLWKLTDICHRNFRENRYFTPWNRPTHVERYKLPPQIQQHQGSRQVPIGDVILSFNDTSLAAETCEELFTPKAPHIDLYVPQQQKNGAMCMAI